MKKLLIAVLILAVGVSTAAQTVRFAYTMETITIDDTSGGVGFTAAKVTANPNQANVVVFTVNCASGTTCVLRFTVDGTAPTTSKGMRALYGDTVTINGYSNNKAFKGIRETAVDVKIDVTYFR